MLFDRLTLARDFGLVYEKGSEGTVETDPLLKRLSDRFRMTGWLDAICGSSGSSGSVSVSPGASANDQQPLGTD
jgi:hypothetical protein